MRLLTCRKRLRLTPRRAANLLSQYLVVGVLGLLVLAGQELGVIDNRAIAQTTAPKPGPGVPDGATPKLSEGTIRAQHGDWQVVCKPPPTGSNKEVCALVQSVTAEDRPNVGLTIYFQKFSSGVRVLRVFAPLGILLPPGIRLTIDNTQVGKAPFLRCHTFACYAQVTLEDKIVSQLTNGTTAIFVIYQTEEEGIGIPISLAGFREALAELN